jgi:hypothetical protein
MDWNLAIENWIDAVNALDGCLAEASAGATSSPEEFLALQAALELVRQRYVSAVMIEAGFNWKIPLGG